MSHRPLVHHCPPLTFPSSSQSHLLPLRQDPCAQSFKQMCPEPSLLMQSASVPHVAEHRSFFASQAMPPSTKDGAPSGGGGRVCASVSRAKSMEQQNIPANLRRGGAHRSARDSSDGAALGPFPWPYGEWFVFIGR